MMWQAIFGGANLVALACWGIMLLAPRNALSRSAVMYCGVGLLSLAYAVMLVLLVSGVVDGHRVTDAGAGGFTSIEGVRALFGSDGGITLGWMHYLALDMFAGMWIARDADAKQVSRVVQAPVLLATFVAGPLGLLIWLVLREPAARRAAGPRKKVNR